MQLSDYERVKTLGFDDPDEVGSSEYRAICECINDGLMSQDQDSPDESPTELARAMLHEFVSHATAMLVKLDEIGVCVLCGTQCVPSSEIISRCPNPGCGFDPGGGERSDGVAKPLPVTTCPVCEYPGVDCDCKEPENGPANNCAKCGTPLGLAATVFTDVAADGGVWKYCSRQCMETH